MAQVCYSRALALATKDTTQLNKQPGASPPTKENDMTFKITYKDCSGNLRGGEMIVRFAKTEELALVIIGATLSIEGYSLVRAVRI
jgi:hypothetical protein